MSRPQLPSSTTVDHVFEALAHRLRRSALAVLIERDGRIPVDELAESVAVELEPAGDTRYGELIEHVTIQLHHSHLPKLDDMGLVEYDRVGRRTVEATPAGYDLEPLLVDEMASRWGKER